MGFFFEPSDRAVFESAMKHTLSVFNKIYLK